MKALTTAVVILVFLVILLAVYHILLRLQLRNINRQLEKRLSERTRQPLSLELINRELNRLTANINKCLKAEENLRLDSIREEKRFKEMIANISHDLRTPLTAIKGYQQLLERGNLSEGERDKLRIAGKHADELGSLIEQFFEYSYLVNAEPDPELRRINLTNLVADCLAEAAEAFEDKHLAVHIAEAAPVYAFADKEMVVRIVHNLIRNCIAHSDGDLEVQIRTTQNAVIVFRNHVKHAAEMDVNRLFERFYTANKAKSRTTGLGLSIVRLLAEQLDGSTSAAMQDGFLEIRVELPV
ncbi:sensor histidine kinase [Paenibacillus sp. HW567]|uniref:sensor histidine kinase n=1 Tax=Paenibacillus sp. HW567 TaxID=1034769 RepID=UPI0003611CB5|nr:HAMP domain-containing sensor histidine kinase [Paenibacillus sp. HW567]